MNFYSGSNARHLYLAILTVIITLIPIVNDSPVTLITPLFFVLTMFVSRGK